MTEEMTKETVREFFGRAFENRRVEDDQDIFAHGFGNSLFALQLVEFIESAFGIEIGNEDLEIENFSSINRIAELVDRKVARIVAG